VEQTAGNEKHSERIFLLSPAKAGGKRHAMLLRPGAQFALAMKLREGRATIGEVYSFMSALYFRGKMAYSAAFGAVTPNKPGAAVIVPGRGLLPPETVIDIEQLMQIGEVEVADDNEHFRWPLFEAAERLDRETGGQCEFVLLGSVASRKYTAPLLAAFGERLLFPLSFIGRGDMSRGGLMLRHANSGEELAYGTVQGTVLRGTRPPRLGRLPKR